ncbi:MAG: LL-diaminopimelate aminotransferase [Endomicrobia bacterium]|nr:LL-diaminopimelate aminotransferase [Endomicrobiia bacterium]MCX7911167.1 LL-diaminopimelate aminotransferase [Endomicrobiia bacterium]
MKYSDKLMSLPPYLFIELDRKKKELQQKGVDIISLGVGDPDLPTHSHIIEAMKKAIDNPKTHQYPFGKGLEEFCVAVANWYKKRFNVELDPNNEVHSLIGSKEGIAHLPLAFVDKDDYVLVPEPGYPVYSSSVILAGGKVYYMSLKEDNNFLPILEDIPKDILKRTKLMFLNYPNNPTTQVATKKFFERVVEFAKEYNIIVAHDCAYSEIYFKDDKLDDSIPPISFLSIKGAKDVGIEFHSLSKTYNMTGWRVGFVCGNKDIIFGLSKVKDNYDSGVFSAIQYAAIAALEGPQDCIENVRQIYKERRDILFNGLRKLGLDVFLPKATFYLWCKVPKKETSLSFAEKLLNVGVVVTPGVGMGKSGEGYVRFALTVPKERIQEALERIKKVL